MLFRMTSGSQVLSYWADDAAGTLTVPSSWLAQLPVGQALISVARYRETPFTVGSRTYLGIGYVEQQGGATLIPTCQQNEAEANDDLGSANAITGSLQTQLNVCGAYGTRGDWDYFSFDATAGQVVSVRTYAADAGSSIDTVIELIAPDGSVFATNDNANPATTDSSLMVQLDDTGSWAISVHHANANQQGSPAHYYNLLVQAFGVSGQAFFFPGTEDGSAPSTACFEIPDSPAELDEGPPAVCTVDVSGLSSASNVNLLVDIAHTYSSDVRLELEHPDGTVIVLNNHTGKIRGIFDLDGAGLVPDDRVVSLDDFDGVNPAGTWTVRATDWYAWDTGTIRSLVLFIEP
jgi:subtilisin-like proprotein convertase family protein